jgi:hypothetical protein
LNAYPVLFEVAGAIQRHRLEAVMIGNSAATLEGAPVTTIDVDFLFRKTPANIKKLKAIAQGLGGILLKPYYPRSDLFRLMRDEDALQLDFHGYCSRRPVVRRVAEPGQDGGVGIPFLTGCQPCRYHKE